MRLEIIVFGATFLGALWIAYLLANADHVYLAALIIVSVSMSIRTERTEKDKKP